MPRSFSTIIQADYGLLNAIIDTFEPERTERIGMVTRLLQDIEGPWMQKPTIRDFHNCSEDYLLLLAVEIEYSEVAF